MIFNALILYICLCSFVWQSNLLSLDLMDVVILVRTLSVLILIHVLKCSILTKKYSKQKRLFSCLSFTFDEIVLHKSTTSSILFPCRKRNIFAMVLVSSIRFPYIADDHQKNVVCFQWSTRNIRESNAQSVY